MFKSINSAASKRTLFFLNKSFFSAYDVCVIGGGPGGYVAAIKAGQLGFKTVCIEKRGSLGGTCLNVGCIPSKALLNISHKYEEAEKHYKDLGINVTGLNYDFGKIMTKKEQIVKGLTQGIEGLFAKNKVDYVKGAGKLTGKTTITATLNDGGEKQIEAKNIIIATGSEATPFPGIPFDEEVFVSSTGALALKKVPKHMIVIGGGYIGLEMGSVYRRLGAQVTVIEYADRLVPAMDSEISEVFRKSMVKQGIKCLVSHKVLSGKRNGDAAELEVQPVKGGDVQKHAADVVLIATGRRPYTEGLGARELGIQIDKQGRIQVNEHFHTGVGNIYAIGDVIPGPMLAHKAEEEGIAAVEFIAGKGGHVNYNAIPGVVYTHPEVATVGKTEEELKKEGVKYNKGVFPFMANSRARSNADAEGMVKVLSDKETDRILGIHIIGPNAGEMIHEGVLGIEYGASSEDLARTCHAHPTLSEAVKEACLATFDKPIHF